MLFIGIGLLFVDYFRDAGGSENAKSEKFSYFLNKL
jgi:hypothetical protein